MILLRKYARDCHILYCVIGVGRVLDIDVLGNRQPHHVTDKLIDGLIGPLVIIDLSIVTMMLQQLRKIWKENITTVMSVEFIIMMVEMTIV